LRLWPTNADYSKLTTEDLKLNRIKNIQYVREPGSIIKRFDIAYLSYREPNDITNYVKLQEHVGDVFNTMWVKDVEGIFNAHQQAATMAESEMFWVVDADADIVDSFDFSYIPDVYDREVVHVWNSINPVTGLEYGYGGVKLFPTELVRKATSWGLDFTTGLSTRFKAMPEVSCVTRFNTDAYSTWRSAFRECVKLTMNGDAEANERLEAWLHPVPDAFFRHEAKRGAEEGKAFAIKNKNNLEELNNINDFKWLHEYYTRNN